MFPTEPSELNAMRRYFVVTSRYGWMFWEMGVPPGVLAALGPEAAEGYRKARKVFDILVIAWQATLHESSPVMFGREICSIVVTDATWRSRRCSI